MNNMNNMNNNTRSFARLVTTSKLTQSEIGRMLGVSQQHVSRLASGQRNVADEYVTTLRTALSKKKEKEEGKKPAKPAKPAKRAR